MRRSWKKAGQTNRLTPHPGLLPIEGRRSRAGTCLQHSNDQRRDVSASYSSRRWTRRGGSQREPRHPSDHAAPNSCHRQALIRMPLL